MRALASRRLLCAGGRRRVLETLAVLRLVLVRVLHLDAVAVEQTLVVEPAVDDDGDALLEDPARVALVADRDGVAVETDSERGDTAVVADRALLDRALDAQPAAGLAAVLRADL